MEQFILQGRIDMDTSGVSAALSSVASSAQSTLSSIGAGFSQVGSTLKSAGTKMTAAVTVPIVAGFTKALNSAADVDKTLQLTIQTMGATAEEAEMMGAAMNKAASNSTLSMSDAATAMLNFARQGFTAEEACKFLEPAMALAVGTGTDLDTVSSGLGNTLKAFGLDASNAGQVTDLLAKAQASANTTTTELFNAMAVGGPIFKTVGWDLSDLATATGIYGDNSISASEGANALKTGVARLAKAQSTHIDVVDKAVDSLFNQDGTMKSMNETLAILHEAFSGLTDEQKINAASTLFGKNQMAKWLVLIENGGSSFDGLNAKIDENTDYCNGLSKALMEGLGGSLESLKASLDVMMVTVGKLIGEALGPFIEKLTALIDKFNNLDEKSQIQIIRWVAMAAAIGPVLLVVGNICSAIGNIIKLFQVLGPIIEGISGVFSSTFGAIGLIIAGAIMAVKNFVDMWRDGWGVIKTILEALGIALAAIGAVLLGAPAAVAAVVAGIVFAISQLAIVIHDNWDAIKAWTKELCENIGNWFKETFSAISDWFKGIGQWAKEAFDSVGEFFSNAVKKISDGFHNVIKGAGDMGDKVKAQFDKMGANVHNAAENLRDKLGTAWESVKNNAVDSFRSMRENVTSTMAGFKEQWAAEFNQAKDTIINTFKDMRSNIVETAKGLASSCNEAFSNIADKAVSGFNKIKEDGLKALLSLKDNAFNAFKEVGDFIESKFKAIINGILSLFSGVDDKVKTIVNNIKEFFNFDWKLPEIKLPHFNFSWRTDGMLADAAQFLGLPGLPDIDVEWYKNGGIMTQPTAFGFNPATGAAMVGGESGAEAILPIDNLREYIREELDNSAMLNTMQDMLAVMQRYLPLQAQTLNNLNFKVNDREFARLVKGVN